MHTTLVWFRQDLRLADNPAFYAAAEAGAVLPVYILDDETAGTWRMGEASRWWLHHSLMALREELAKHGLPLLLRRGRAADIIPRLVQEVNAKAVYWNRCYEPYAIARDTALKAQLQAGGLEVRSFNASLLYEPWEIHNKQGGVFKVFTPFWKHCMQREAPAAPLPVPAAITASPIIPPSDDISSWALLPVAPDWAGGLRESWIPGEMGAQARLEQFLQEGFATYADQRDYPAQQVTTRLSPHLHFGEISPRVLWHRVYMHNSSVDSGVSSRNLTRILDEIGWREFSAYTLYHFPDLPELPYKRVFSHFPWKEDTALFNCWKRGKTGYPIVDAGMRELWHTGFMHNRVRMIVASFLTKDLFIPWQWGAAWFWDTLVDADLANNSASWQWVAGCGMDAAPYFRIFNPTTQSQRFDQEGCYIRRWLPELKALPDDMIHAPWEASPLLLRQFGVTLGKTYPHPVVNHKTAREQAMEGYRMITAAS